MRKDPSLRPISVGPFGNRIVYDPVAKTITRHFAFRKAIYYAIGAHVSTDVFQNGRNMNLVFGAANLLRSGKVTVSLTITFPDYRVIQWSATERGMIIEGYRMAAQRLEAVVNRANVQHVATFGELDSPEARMVAARAYVDVQTAPANSRVDIR